MVEKLEKLNNISVFNNDQIVNKEIVIELYKVGKLAYKVAENIINKMHQNDSETCPFFTAMKKKKLNIDPVYLQIQKNIGLQKDSLRMLKGMCVNVVIKKLHMVIKLDIKKQHTALKERMTKW